jgi:NAD-dependent SIR2 family protein deacetylase
VHPPTVDADEVLADLAELVAAGDVMVLSGAGLSTESGIPDYRGPTGALRRSLPMTYQTFTRDLSARRRDWARSQLGWRHIAKATPNDGHRAVAALEAAGALSGIVTQNVDGLHQDAGSLKVVELHGTNRVVRCLDCEREHAPAAIQERLVAGCDEPLCDGCRGPLKPATISFGQSLRHDVLAEAFSLARAADLLLVLGTSLVVYPAAAIPEAAAEAGARVVIVNREPTPLDGIADVVLLGQVEELLPAIVAPSPRSGDG